MLSSPELIRFRKVIAYVRDNPGCRKADIFKAIPDLSDGEWRRYKDLPFWGALARHHYYPSGWHSPLMSLPGGPYHSHPERAGHDYSTHTKQTAWTYWGDLTQGRWPDKAHGLGHVVWGAP